ncbi:helix-turn-helix domain-containing protein [Streptomyces cavernicola]|uniref:helix-turn-helix domain-containing protein n=1 Tax=Streptomyces cavernicola TaxID=3043613 RepID=UPI0038D16B4B
MTSGRIAGRYESGRPAPELSLRHPRNTPETAERETGSRTSVEPENPGPPRQPGTHGSQETQERQEFPEGQAPEPGTVWARPERAARSPSASHSRDELAAAAVELVDRRGLDAVSVRQVAKALGPGQASLYRYITGRDDLLDLMDGSRAPARPGRAGDRRPAERPRHPARTGRASGRTSRSAPAPAAGGATDAAGGTSSADRATPTAALPGHPPVRCCSAWRPSAARCRAGRTARCGAGGRPGGAPQRAVRRMPAGLLGAGGG